MQIQSHIVSSCKIDQSAKVKPKANMMKNNFFVLNLTSTLINKHNFVKCQLLI